MADIDLDAMAERAEAATPGPWATERIHHRPDGSAPHWCWDVLDEGAEGGEPEAFVRCIREDELDAAETAEFIAHAREDVPALVAEVRRLTAALDASAVAFARATARRISAEAALRKVGALFREAQSLVSKYTRAPGENGDRVADLLTDDAYRIGADGLAILARHSGGEG